MSIGRAIRRRAQAIIAPCVFLSLTGYFCWSATQGDRGLQASVQRREQLSWAQTEQSRVAAERDQWERRVGNLRTQRLDPDLLDERARSMLGLADPAESVVQYGPGRKLY